MVKGSQKKKMMDFLVGRLETAHDVVKPMTYGEIESYKVNCIKIGDNGVVLLVDRIFPNNSLDKAFKFFRSKGAKELACVFYKDGEDFFRSAVKSASPKSFLEMSLKRYNGDMVRRMLSLRPEEIAVAERNGKNLLYYQPKSALNETLFTIDVKPVKFDYSHVIGQTEAIDPTKPATGDNVRPRYVPEDKNSKRIYIWDDKTRKDITGNLKLTGNTLV